MYPDQPRYQLMRKKCLNAFLFICKIIKQQDHAHDDDLKDCCDHAILHIDKGEFKKGKKIHIDEILVILFQKIDISDTHHSCKTCI